MNKKHFQPFESDNKRIDFFVTLLPFLLILFMCFFFFLQPDRSNEVLSAVRSFLGDAFGLYYLVIGLFFFLLSLFLCFSRFGEIRLGGREEKPKYSFFSWGSMMFTAGLAADILFYSLCEWISYAEEPRVLGMGPVQDWASTFTLFHWGPIPWAFYLVLAVAFGFMLHVRKRSRQKYSEACRPLLGKGTEGFAGRLVDLLAVFALLAGTATTFSVATPLLAEVFRTLFNIPMSERALTVLILIVTCLIYTYSVMKGMRGVSILANACTYLFYGLLAYVLLFGGEARYILDTGFSALGRLCQNFFTLATYTDPLRETGFAQNWTIFFWAYWMVWCVAAPFFIGSISRGRTVRQTILGGYVFGMGSTVISFIVLGNYGLGLQVLGKLDVVGIYHAAGNMYETIIAILRTLPLSSLVLLVMSLSMIAFYATSFDSIALVASQYTYQDLAEDEEPAAGVKAFWSVLLILLPVALVFSESSMANLQSVSIIAAFPIGFVMLLIVASFLKDAGQYLEKEGEGDDLEKVGHVGGPVASSKADNESNASFKADNESNASSKADNESNASSKADNESNASSKTDAAGKAAAVSRSDDAGKKEDLDMSDSMSDDAIENLIENWERAYGEG